MNNVDNKKFLLAILSLLVSMILLSFASVPIYNLFCKATGFGGTTQQEISYQKHVIGTRQVVVEFDANIDPALPWNFVPKQRRISILTGEHALVFYEAENLSDYDIVGTSVYNVTPNRAGQYFVKVHCFCFEEQLLKAGQKILMPVSFYIHPDFDKDPEMSDIKTITLSYSFFKVRTLPK